MNDKICYHKGHAFTFTITNEVHRYTQMNIQKHRKRDTRTGYKESH